MKEIKVDFKKVDELEKEKERVEEVVWYWSNKAVDDKNLSWDEAMNSACKELGINRAELATLLYGNEPFEDITRAMLFLKQRKMWQTDGDRILNDLFGEERRRRIAKNVD
ncbi:MAG: hypothetical protein ACE5J9_10770 [Methanosarcinales archaeon]